MKQFLLVIIFTLSAIATKADEKVTIPGLIYSKSKAEIISEESGILMQVKNVGESFEKGDVLFELKNDYQKQVLNSLLAQKKSIKNKLEKLTIQAMNYKRLAERGITSKDSAIEKDIGVLNAKIELSNIQQRLIGLRDILSKKIIHAPFSGVVSNKLVNQYSSVTKGMHILTVFDNNKLFAKARIPAYIAKNLGNYSAVLAVEKNEPIGLELDYIAPEISTNTNTVEISYRITNMDLVVGQSVFIEFRN